MSTKCEIIDDVTEDKMRTVYFSCDKNDIVTELIKSDAYTSHTNFGQQTTITLCKNNFLQSIDIIEDIHPDEEISFDDFFTSENDDNDNTKSHVTSVILYPYIPHEDLSQKTGRDYIQEMDDCIKYVKNISENI